MNALKIPSGKPAIHCCMTLSLNHTNTNEHAMLMTLHGSYATHTPNSTQHTVMSSWIRSVLQNVDHFHWRRWTLNPWALLHTSLQDATGKLAFVSHNSQNQFCSAIWKVHRCVLQIQSYPKARWNHRTSNWNSWNSTENSFWNSS